jgi:hypothetical protein
MYTKSLAVVLFLFGIFLTIGGAGAIAISKETAPLFYAMVLGLTAFGLMCLAAAYAVYKGRVFGFRICIALGLIAAVFAIYVKEPIGNGYLWPTTIFMLANGLFGLRLPKDLKVNRGTENA